MNENSIYYLAVIFLSFLITYALRGLPFLILKRLSEAQLIKALATWIPPGILTILVLYAVNQSQQSEHGGYFSVILASLVTIAVHLLSGRKMILSIAAGTLAYVLLVNFVF